VFPGEHQFDFGERDMGCGGVVGGRRTMTTFYGRG
jgi:hypothetical protein